MRSFEILVAKDPNAAREDDLRSRAETSAPRSSVQDRRRVAREVLDVFIEGANVTARVADAQAACVLRDLGRSIVELAESPHGKSIVRFYDDPWEMCIERTGARALLSVYRAGGEPHVAVHDRTVSFEEVIESVLEAMDGAIERGEAPRAVEIELRSAREALARVDRSVIASSAPGAEPTPVTIEIDRDSPLAFGADFTLRPRLDGRRESSVERADLHALLFRGRLRAEVRGRSIELGDGYPMLVAERLLDFSRRALDAWERAQSMHFRSDANGLLLGARVAPNGTLALTIGASRMPGLERTTYTFPALGVVDLALASLSLGRALVRALLRRDRTQCTNLRLSAFRRDLRDTSDMLREVSREDAKVNPEPEAYRAFAEGARTKAPDTGPGLAAARLRYQSRWRALVPGIDLRSTFLCGDRLVVGAATETFCLARTTGEILWRTPTTKATSVVTPGGIARLHPDGIVEVHDFGTGEVTLRTRLAPRVTGPSTGAVVNVPGLPRLLVLTEGAHHLVALDLTSGEPRWRFSWGQRGTLRLKRSGKLLYCASGDSALTAVDVLSGAVVWRMRDRLRFRSAPTVDHDALFALAGGAHSAARIHAVDPFSGESIWTSPALGERDGCSIDGSPLAAKTAVVVPTRERRGLHLTAFDRANGKKLWSSNEPVAPVGTSWLAIDDLLVGNTPTGELLAVEATTGALRYRHVLGGVIEADVPRRLEPVLRSGALFVPHADVHVIRPADGTHLATIAPCDAIPDLLRVDERCDVYVAEESGHLVSFSAGPRLSLVRGGASIRSVS
ncbi:MAG: PQQ-binding-like beta-propeller repeat protein [Polyangiaceae bacterium]